MAGIDEKLSQVTPATVPLTGSELVYVVQGGSSKRTTAAALADVLPDATPSTPGKLSAADKTRLDQLAATGSPSFAGLTITGPNAVVIPHIHGSLYGSIYFHVKNTSGVALTKGTPVTAGDSVGDTDVLQVVATDPATPGAEYANGVLRDDLAVDGEGYAIIVGELQDVNTAAYTRGPLWVAGGGGLTSTRPASGAQQVATLGRHHAVNGSLLVAIKAAEPTAAQIGADSAGTASAAIFAHLAAADPHAQYTTLTEAVAAAPVQSVAGRTGAVVLSPADVGAQPADADLTAIAALTTQPFGRGLLTVADAAAARTLIGATVPSGGGGSPAGTATEIQYRSGTALGAIPNSAVDGTTGTVTLARLLLTANGAASMSPLALIGTWFSGGTTTTTKPHFLIESTGTASTNWTAAGTGLGLNAPSGFPGNLLDCQINGVSVFKVGASSLVLRNAAGTGTHLAISGTDSVFGQKITCMGSADLGIGIGSGVRSFQAVRLWFENVTEGGYLAYSSGFSTYDLFLRRDDGDIFAQRNGANAQTSRIYNTFTSTTNFERAKIEWTNNILRIGTEKGSGGGTARDMELQTDGTARITIRANGAIIFTGLPTTNPAVTGQLWNDAGTLKISA